MSESFERLVVLDFEATCEDGGAPSPQEIIELPSVLVSLSERRILDEHESFVRPVFHPRLSDFCTALTGIRQEDVDGAPTFPEALATHGAWLAEHGLADATGEARFAFVTCGDWDLRSMLPRQCAASRVVLPRVYRRWINVKTIFAKTLRRPASQSMPSMLSALGLPLEGRHHRGIDDCRNIARIVLALHARGALFELTGRLAPPQFPELPLVLLCGGQRAEVTLKKRQISALLGLSGSTFRTKVTRIETPSGDAITDDEALADLLPSAELVVHART